MIRDVVKEVLVKVLIRVLFASVIVFMVYLMFDFANSDIADAYANASTALGSRSVNVSKSQFKQEYEELLSGELAGIDSESYTGTGSKTDLSKYYSDKQLDFSKSQVYSVLELSSYKAKAGVLALVYDVIMQKYNNANFAIGLMANVVAEANTGIVEYKYSLNHNEPWDVSNWSGGSSCSKIRTIEDIEYLLSIPGDSATGRWSVGVGMVQWSYGRRQTLCQKYLDAINDTSLPVSVSVRSGNEYILSDDFLAYVELQMMMDEFEATYRSVAEACCNADSIEECAKIICLNYEKPSEMEFKAKERAAIARNIADLILGGAK